MKLTKATTLLVLGVVLTIAASGCRKHPYGVTPLQGSRAGSTTDIGAGKEIAGTPEKPSDSAIPQGIAANSPDAHKDWIEDRNQFAANTVHFAFDSSEVKESEKGNVTAVADYLKAHSEKAVKIEGHCDERGTAEYNRALGERRASALREELVKLGVPAGSVDTISYGFDRPVAEGHDESAWSKNRRGEFVLLTAPSAAAAK